MAKNTNFANWQSDSISRDRCAVCWNSMGYRSRSNYCSDRCVEVAKLQRAKIRNCAIRYQLLGFTIAFVEGLYPECQLPDYAQKYYAHGKDKFYPVIPSPINLNFHAQYEFKRGMLREIGAVVYNTIELIDLRKSANVIDVRHQFESTLADLMFIGEGIFICPDCGVKSFDGCLTKSFHEHSCCSFEQVKFPF